MGEADDPIVPQGVTLREFDDPAAARKGIYDGTLEALKTRFPLENKSYRLELSNVRYTGPQSFTLAQQKQALLTDKNLHTPVTGHFKLFRKSDGALVDEKDEVVMNVPYYTDRGTIINNGSEYTVANQLRLRPGVYTRIRRSGDVETQFNVKPGSGRGFRLRMEPATGVITVNVGHANMPLYPLLKTLGVTDKQMIKAWGADVAYANAAKADSVSGRSAIDKLYQAFAGYNADAQDLVSKEEYLRRTLPKFWLDPGVTSRTLGIAAEGVTPEVLLRASAKMFNVNRGDEQQDDRDNPGFANVYGIEDLYRERIEKDAGKLSKNLMWKISRAGSLKPIVRGAFSGWHDELLQGSGLAMPGDNSNPMALEEQMMRVTRFGEGGISSPDLLTDEARQMNTGNLNFIDFIAGPENARIGADARLGVYTRKGSDGKLYSLFLNRQGKKEYVPADVASDSVIGFPGADPKATSVPAVKRGRVQMVPREEVDYFVPAIAGMFASHINLNPMPTSVQGGRQFYASKFWAQYMPTVSGETPLVSSLMPDGKTTWEEHYGRRLGTLKAGVDGTVTKVTDKGVTVTSDDGKRNFIETVTDFPFNGLTGLTYKPTVKVGDKVAADDMVAASNFVDPKTGSLAMGHNMKVAWIPAKGHSVSGDTSVLWRRPDGSFTFGPIANVQIGPGMGSIAVDPKSGEQHIIDATAWMIHKPDSKMYCVTMSNGATVKVTGSHGMMKYDGHHGLIECRADKLVPGKDVVAFIRPELPFGTGPDRIECESTHHRGAARTFPLDRDFGWLVGIFLSEGCVVYRNGIPHSVSIACTERDIIDKIAEIAARFEITCTYRKSEYEREENGMQVTSGKATLGSSSLASWFAAHTGRYAWGKYLPDIVWTGPREFADGLIDGYICGDGCITDKQCTISTSSPVMADGLCLLLGAIGVRANNRRYRSYTNPAQKHAIHMVYMYRETVQNLPRISLRRKDDSVAALREFYDNSKKFKIGDIIPIPSGAPYAFSNGKPTVSRDKARAMLEEYLRPGRRAVPGSQFIADAMALIDGPLMWSRVQSVTEVQSEEYVYDLEMRPYGTFVVGYGLVVHNSYEDAIALSESAAKKLATDRTYGFEADPGDGGELGLSKYMSSFPQRFTKEQFATLDDNGVVKEGTVLHRGDPIAVAVGPKLLTAEDANLGKLSKVLRGAFTDKAQIWEHDYPGTVVSSTVFRGRAKVNVKAAPPLMEGDKMCYDEETEVLTSHGWRYIKDITLDDNVATLNPDTGEFDYLKPDLVHKYAHHGKMYALTNSCLDLLVTPNHRMFVKRRNGTAYEFIAAEDVVGKRVSYKKDGIWKGHELPYFTFPAYQIGHRWGLLQRPELRISMDTFLMILGMYLSEGSCYECVHKDGGRCGSGIAIAQKKPHGVAAAEEALRSCGLHYTRGRECFRIPSRHLYNYFSQFGYAWEKRIPEFVFGLSARQQKILFKWMMWGEGHCANGVPKTYTTSSAGLADDVQRLCLHIGIAARICDKQPAGHYNGMIDGHKIYTKHDSYTVQIINAKLTPTVNHGHVKQQHTQREGFVDYSGFVYCCTMPKWHAIYVRRHGHVCWCGNSPRYALKGTVGKVIPDDKMPRNAATNEPYDILMNPMGIPSRIAPGQLIESALGKLAKATGKQLRIPQDPPPEGWASWAKAQLDAAGVPTTSDVFDPETGRTLKGIGDGYVYWHAMHHIADKKLSAKGGSGGYTADLQPAKGGVHGAKRSSGLDAYAMLAHGATEVMKDIQTTRGERNGDYWRAVRSGGPLPMPKVPFVYQKAMNLLRAGGINVVEGQKSTDILPMTDKDTDRLAGGRLIANSKMLDFDLKELKGGLFDPKLTGGNSNQDRWAAIALPEPIPNPVMEEPVRRVLGLTTKKLQAVISGEEKLDGKTGGAALVAALSKIDIDQEIARQKDIVRRGRGPVRDNAIKVIGYLDGCRQQGVTPKDWMVTKVPVIPPMFRPIAKAGDTMLVADINELYRDVIESADAFKQLQKDVPDSGLTEERLNVYNAVKAAYGLGSPISPEGQAKGLKGAIRQVIGAGSPKCYSADTEILTLSRRWIPVTELSMEDTVATVRPDTYALEWQKPVDITHAAYSGKMVRIYSKKLDTLVTPNHKHFVEIRHGRGINASFSHAEKVDAGKLLQVRSRWRMLTAPDGGQSGTVPRTDFGGIKFSSPEALARFLGMYVAEGWVPYRGEKATQVTICQDSSSIHVPYIDGFCDGLGIEVSRAVYARKTDKFRKVAGKCIWWTVNDHTFAQWVLKNFGSGSENKHFSDEVLSWDARYLRLIVEAYMRGDGENNKGRIKTDRAALITYKNKDALTVYGSRASTVSPALVDDMANLCMRIGLGFRVTDVVHYPDHREWRTKYRFRVDGWNKVVGGDSSVKTGEVDYDGTVHCCTVRNGLLVLRRKGMTFVSGNSGLWQAKVLSKAVDGIGRAVIGPEPNYDMDQCGIPEDAAWTVYKDYVVRGLARRGYPQERALQLVDERAPVAKDILIEEMGRRPVILDRAPTWHKFNFMAFWPSLVKGNTIRVNPLVEKAYTADHDGDQMNFHVPSSDKAVQEAIEKMMPSKNLLSTTDLRNPRYVPNMEMTLGLAKLTAPQRKGKPRFFLTAQEAIRAYRRGEIGANDPVSVLRA